MTSSKAASTIIFAALVIPSACAGTFHQDVGGNDTGGGLDGGSDLAWRDAARDLMPLDVVAVDTLAPAPMYSELWYSSGDKLVYVQINAEDGTVTKMVPSQITGLKAGQNAITMLADGSLLLLRCIVSPKGSEFYHVKDPPRDGSPTSFIDLGPMKDDLMIEALYTDCEGRLYGMDTGADVGSATGNRLILFTGNYLGGDFTYKAVTDLAHASTADIDDMGPGIDGDGNIVDNPGFAIDTGAVYNFDYLTGTGTHVGNGGSWGIHALGGPLFTDGKSRLYLMSQNAEIFLMDWATHEVSSVLATGPQVNGDVPGHGGLTGPLTNCITNLVIP